MSRYVERHLRKVVEEGDPPPVGTSLVANVVQALTGLTLIDGEREQPLWMGKGEVPIHLLAMKNGLLDVEAAMRGTKGALRDPTPEWFTLAKLPYEYQPQAKAPRFLAFLREVLEGDRERTALIQEWFGLNVVYDTSFQKFLLLEGDGANGKSVLLEVLTCLLGEDNVSHVPIEVFGERFQLAPTIGKLANIAPEVTGHSRVADGLLKQFVSGERMFFDRKNRSPLHVRPTARLIIAANNRLGFRDESEGLWRRMIIVPFNRAIPPDRQNRRLAEELKEELPGILNWALVGLRRLRQRNGFTEPKVSAVAAMEYRLDVNPARAFLAEECELEVSSSVAAADLYSQYRQWCESNGHEAQDSRAFGREVHRSYPGVQKRRLGPRQARVWRYFGLRKRVSSVSSVLSDSQLGLRKRGRRGKKRKKGKEIEGPLDTGHRGRGSARARGRK